MTEGLGFESGEIPDLRQPWYETLAGAGPGRADDEGREPPFTSGSSGKPSASGTDPDQEVWDYLDGQQTGLTKAAALARLRELGVSDLAAVRAIEMAPATKDGIIVADGHLVSFSEGYGWAVTPRNQPEPGPADVYNLAWALRAVEIVDRYLDEAAPEVFRQDNEASRIANRFRRLAAGPASEGQEAVDALNLAVGGNPRKGVTGTEDDVLLELGDTVSAALFAIQSITKDTGLTWQWVLAALSKALNRVPPDGVASMILEAPGQDDDDFPPVMVPGDV